jgi:hypothetical protein
MEENNDFDTLEACTCGLKHVEGKIIEGYKVAVCSCGEIRFVFQYYDASWRPIHKEHPLMQEGEIK